MTDASRPPDEPRVLLLGLGAPGPSAGGAERYFGALLAGLGPAARGVVVGPTTAPSPGLAVVSHAQAPLWSRLVACARAARTSGPADVVDAHFPLYAALPVLIGSRRRTPLVVHFQGPWAAEVREERGSGWLTHATRRAVERAVYRRARVLVVLSGAFARVLVERERVSPWSVEIVAPGVDLARWRDGDRAAARARLGIGDDDWLAVSVRRLVPRTGIDVLVDAWSAFRDDDRAHLVVAGDGPLRDALATRAVERGLGSRVRFLGHVPDAELADLYAAADVSVVPTRAWEGYGLVVLESLAAGTPVVVTDEGGLPQAVEGLGHDLVVPSRDPDALAARLRGARLGTLPLPSAAACRRHAAAHDWDGVVSTHRALYLRAAGRDRDERIRVLYLDHCARRSGGEIALARVLGALGEVDPHVVLFESGPIEAVLGAVGATTEVLPLAGVARDLARGDVRPSVRTVRAVASAVWLAARLTIRIRRLRPDVVHANSTKAAIVGSVAARLAGRPLVWHQRELLDDARMARPVRRLVRALAGRASAALIVNSEATRATIAPAPPRAPVFVVPDCAPAAPTASTASTDGMHRSVSLGVVGRLAPQKGQREFLVAFARYVADDPTVQARVVGGPLFGEEDYERELHGLVERLGLTGRVTFAGHRDDVGRELADLDVVVVPSTVPEGFGLSVLEAMAAGRAVIATRPGGPSELVTDGVDGLLVPCGDVTALGLAMRRLAGDEHERRRLGTAARVRAGAFTPAHAAAHLVLVYRSVLGRTGAP